MHTYGLLQDARTKTKHTVGFKCSSASACKHLWRAAVEQRLFYTLPSCSKRGVVVTGGSFFSRGTRFRYQGRCEREVVLDSTGILREAPRVRRTPHLLPRSASLPTTPPHHGQGGAEDEEDDVPAHRRLPYIDRSTSLDEEVLCGGGSPAPPHSRTGSRNVSYCPESNLPPLLEPGTEGVGEGLEGGGDSLEAHEDAQALHAAWSRGAYSRSHTLDLPEDASSSATTAHPGINYPTGSLPRHISAYTPPSPKRHNTPQLTHGASASLQASPLLQPHASPQLSQMSSAAGSPLLPTYSSHTLPHAMSGSSRHGSPHRIASYSASHKQQQHFGKASPDTRNSLSPQLSFASVHSIPAMDKHPHHQHQLHAAPSKHSVSSNTSASNKNTLHQPPPPHQQSLSHQQHLYPSDQHLHPKQSGNNGSGTSQSIRSTHSLSHSASTWSGGQRRSRWTAVCGFVGVFARALVCVVCALVVVAVCVLESKPTGLLHSLRARPEMMLLRLHYYQPFKRALGEWGWGPSETGEDIAWDGEEGGAT